MEEAHVVMNQVQNIARMLDNVFGLRAVLASTWGKEYGEDPEEDRQVIVGEQ